MSFIAPFFIFWVLETNL